MFTSKGLNKMTNRIHEKSLRLVLNDHQSTLDEMLDTLNEKTIHQQCIDRLLTEVYKFLNGYSPDIMNDVFHLRQNTYNLRNFHVFATGVPRNNCMLKSVVYRANQLWETLPFDLKNSCSLELFKKEFKKLALHWISMSNLLKVYSCWIHLVVHISILFRILLAIFFFFFFFFDHDVIVYFRR